MQCTNATRCVGAASSHRCLISLARTPPHLTLRSPQGPVTAGQIISVLPFSNTLSIKRIKGADLIAALQYGVSGVGTGAITGRFPQVGAH